MNRHVRAPFLSSRFRSEPALFALLLCLPGLVFAQIPPGPGDYGDAPEGAPAYPTLGITGLFPTCFGGPSGYVRHANLFPLAWFGLDMDSEPDGNGGFCPTPPYEMDECWGSLDNDAGLVNTTTFTIYQGNVQPCSVGPIDPIAAPCSVVQWGGPIDMMVSNLSGAVARINVLFDWDQDGRWGGQSLCPGGGPVPEHVIQNLPVPDGYVGMLSGLSPGALLVGPHAGPVWARFTISDGVPVPIGWDGAEDFDTGETEDYLLTIDQSGGLGELGDAPEGVPAYPDGTLGQFPTCISGAPVGFVYHTAPISSFFGAAVDLEGDGNHDLCNFSLHNNDECDSSGGDAGLLRPRAYDLVGGSLVHCSAPGVVPTLPGPCQRVSWGGDLDIMIDNSGGPAMYLNVLADWDHDGSWGQTVTCASGDVGGEHVLVNESVPAGFSGPASLLGLPSFRALSNPGPVWFRFTLSDAAVATAWNGEGYFGDGETEDYLLHVGTPSAVPQMGVGAPGLRLWPAGPNPFNPQTAIRCELDRAAVLDVTVHDARGRLVRTLAGGVHEAGSHELTWHGDDDAGRRLESGVYLVRAVAGGTVRTVKIALLK